jgi:hypothetical protein
MRGLQKPAASAIAEAADVAPGSEWWLFVSGVAIEKVLCAAGFVFILQLRHSLDQRLKLVIGQVWNQWSNSRRQIPS